MFECRLKPRIEAPLSPKTRPHNAEGLNIDTAPADYAMRTMASEGTKTASPPRTGLERSAGVQRLLSHFRPRLGTRMARTEMRAEAIVGASFLLTAVPLAVFGSGQGNRSPAVILLATQSEALAAVIPLKSRLLRRGSRRSPCARGNCPRRRTGSRSVAGRPPPSAAVPARRWT